MNGPRHIVHTSELDWSQAFHGRHPFNPSSEMRMARLGGPAGLKRLGVQLIRIPPGKQSFIPHAHSMEEEFVFIIEGAGEVTLDGVAHPIGPGDFIGFPTDGVVHHLTSTGPGDLVYLTAGERSRVEVSDMPSIGKTAVFRNDAVTLFGGGDLEHLTMAEWFARMKVEER
jgi:uncharacterized cupin superfamily protein